MSTSHVRLVVAGLSLILAVFTGVLTGFVGGGDDCDTGSPTKSPTSQAPATGQSTAPGQGSPSSIAPENSNPPDNNKGGANPSGGGPFSTTGTGDDQQPGGPPAGIENALTVDCKGGGGGFSGLTAFFGFAAALVTALVIGGVALFVPRTDEPVAAAPAYAPPAPNGPTGRGAGSVSSTATGSHPVLGDAGSSNGESRRLGKERKTLVETCIYVRDRATSKAIADRLAWALNEVGVVEDRPTGQAFDTARHEAGGTAPTDDQRMEGTIAAVEISGYTDRGTVVRAPVVTVFRSETR